MHSIKEMPFPFFCCYCNANTKVAMTREHMVCTECGSVLDSIIDIDSRVKPKSKPYAPVHHFSERLAAFNMTGPPIKDEKFLFRLEEVIKWNEEKSPLEKYKGGPSYFTRMIKEIKRVFKKDYSKRKYHERFVFIRNHFGIEDHPKPSRGLLTRLRLRYQAIYRAFEKYKDNKKYTGRFIKKRNNIININYVTCQLLQQEGATEFVRFFSFIKGNKTNRRDIERYWKLMKSHVQNVVEYRDDSKVLESFTWDEPDLSMEDIEKLSFYDPEKQ